MVEFLIVLPVMLLLVMGILQFAFIYQAKITLNYAAFQTARAGSLNNASMSAMEKVWTVVVIVIVVSPLPVDQEDWGMLK